MPIFLRSTRVVAALRKEKGLTFPGLLSIAVCSAVIVLSTFFGAEWPIYICCGLLLGLVIAEAEG